MGLTIKKPDGTVLSSSEGTGTAEANEQAQRELGKLVLGRALHLTADGTVVEEDDVAGVTVLGGKGSTMSPAQIERYGLNESHTRATIEAPAPQPEPAPEPEPEPAPAPEPAPKATKKSTKASKPSE